MAKTISLDVELYDQAINRAERLGLTFSAYIQRLVQQNIDAGGALVLRERDVDSRPERYPAHRHHPALIHEGVNSKIEDLAVASGPAALALAKSETLKHQRSPRAGAPSGRKGGRASGAQKR